MLKNKKGTKKSLQNINSKKPDASKPAANIFKLVKKQKANSIRNSHYYYPYKKDKDNLQFATDLIKFLEEYNLEELSQLSFDSNTDTLATLNGSLLSICEKYSIKVVIDDEDPAFKMRVLYPVDYDTRWYLLEMKYLLKIKNEGLRIGYAHLLSNFDEGTGESFTEWRWQEGNDTPFDYRYDDAKEMIGMYSEEDDEEHRKFIHGVDKLCIKAQEYLKVYNELRSKSINVFYGYQPETEEEIELKKLIEKGLKYNFNIVREFEFDDDFDNGYVLYNYFHKIVFDLDNELEERFTEELESDANNNGMLHPSGYMTLDDDGDVIDKTPKEMRDEFIESCVFIADLGSFIYDKFNDK